MFKSNSLIQKITIMLIAILCIGFISLTLFSTFYAQSIISDKVYTQLQKRVDSISSSIETYDDSLKSVADNLYEVFEAQFQNIEIDNSQTVDVNGVKTPLITNQGERLNLNFSYVDNYTKIKGSTATVFARMGDDFVRVTTSLKRTDGSRTLGTFLGKKSPAYESIMNKKRYFGTAHLFGSEYMAVYNPIVKDGEVIGILYVGYNYTKSYGKLLAKLRDIKIGNEGYLYIISTKAKTRGSAILHPTYEGKSMLELKDEDGFAFVEEMLKSKSGKLMYKWKGNEKSVIFKDYADRNWKLVIGANIDDFLEESNKMRIILFSLSFVILLIVIVISISILRSVVIKPLHKLQDGLSDFFAYLNGEKSSSEAIIVNSKDEIGEMSILVNENIDKIKRNIDVDNTLISNTLEVASSVSSGYLDKRITQHSNNQKLNELKDVVNKMLENIQNRVASIQSVLNLYSNFDYRAKVSINDVSAQFKELYENTNNLGLVTSMMLKESLKTGEELESNSNHLKEIVNSLSRSSNEQASSLEETAAALEELTTAMTSNEDNIQMMSQNAKLLLAEVSSGQKMASNTAVAMDDINEQTNAIADAITVIDQIAFQTNILSLNAAVEAATAGESGKGFAVVAGEVRNLASRSSEAAKEIKDLVESATTKTDEGKHIAQNMINGYEKLKNNIEGNTTLITDVTRNSKEQLVGIEQINNAVASLDKLTQNNAMVASEANDIAIQTNTIAKIIVEDVNKKKFDK